MPEIGGEYLADSLIPEFYSYDYFQNYIRLALGEPVAEVDSNFRRKKESISQICFITPPEGNSKLASINNPDVEIDKKVFLNTQLKKTGEVVNTKDGNACRVQVIGVTATSKMTPDELDTNIRKKYDAKFE
jgi:hypothetical protein